MSSRRLAVLVGLALLIVIGPIVGANSAQPASRYSLTAGIAEHGSVDLGPYRDRLGVDYSVYEGELRSDKAPGQPVLAVPVYLAGRALGAASATQARISGDLGLWWSTFWTATVPLAALVALMYLFAERFARRGAALAVALIIGIGTMMLPHAVNLYAHSLSALLGFGAWMLIEQTPTSIARAVWAGALAGAAVATEYECGIILVVLAAYVMVRQTGRLTWFLLGSAAPLGFLALYQWCAFGAPWRTPAAFYAIKSGYSIPGVYEFGMVLFGNRGIFIGAPIALVGLVGAVWLVASGEGAPRRHAIVALAIAVPYLVLCAGWSGFPVLEYPGLRYLIPALPFLAVPLAVLWDRLWRPIVAAGILGALIAVPIATTFVLFGEDQQLLPELARRMRAGEFLPTLWSMGFGPAGTFVYGVSVVACVAACVVGLRRDPDPSRPPGARGRMPMYAFGSDGSLPADEAL